jgi:carbamate kinase
MRILLALGRNAKVEAAAKAIVELADRHEVIVSHDSGPQIAHELELALRNALPDRDIVSVLTQVVVAGGDVAVDGDLPSRPAPEPWAIAEIRSLRVLLAAGALVICASGGLPVALDELGTMHRVDADLAEDLTVALLARRLDVDLLLMASDGDAADAVAPKLEAVRRFARATGRQAAVVCRFARATVPQAAVVALADAVRVARTRAVTLAA